jgi:hypothetical protein
MTVPRLVTTVVATVLVGGVLVGCGSGSSKVVNTPTTSVTGSSSPASSGAAAPSASGKRQPALTIAPATNLKDQQVVHVTGFGFSPNEALQVIECAQKGDSTGPGDCNLTAMTGATSDANGAVSTDLTVVRGPFGANNIVCSAQQPCLVSVTQASLSPTEEADATIQFATS